jgi:hypothetical protein
MLSRKQKAINMGEKASKTMQRLGLRKNKHQFWAAAKFGELKMLTSETDERSGRAFSLSIQNRKVLDL